AVIHSFDFNRQIDLHRLRQFVLVGIHADAGMELHRFESQHIAGTHHETSTVAWPTGTSMATRIDRTRACTCSAPSAAARTTADPTTTPSASAETCCACSGVDTPNPTHTGNVVTLRTRAIVAGRSAASAARSPVTPKRLMRYTNPRPAFTIA